MKTKETLEKGLEAIVLGKFSDWVGLDIVHDKALKKSPKKTLKAIQKKYGMKELPNFVYTPVCLNWSLKNFGFGELTFWMEDGKVHCNNECMPRDTVKKILCVMVDQAVLSDEPKAK